MDCKLFNILMITFEAGSAMIALPIALCAALLSQPDLQSHYSDCRGGTAVIAQALISHWGIRR